MRASGGVRYLSVMGSFLRPYITLIEVSDV
jgi:hypothetical protein